MATTELPNITSNITLDTGVLKRQRQFAKLRGATFYHVFVIVLGALMLYPVVWLFASSLKAPDEVWSHVNTLIPSTLHFENYAQGWQGFGGITFATFYKNSFIYAGFGTLFAVTTSAVVAYAFARLRFSGRNFWFAIMLLTLMLPTQVLIIPQYIIFSKLGWLNTFLPLLLP